MKANDLTAEVVLSQITKVCQSKKELAFDDTIIFTTSILRMPRGGASEKLLNYIAKKRSIIKITNTDKLCALRAIVIGMAHADKKNDPSKNNIYRKLYRKKSKLQDEKTYQLAKAVGIKTGPCGLDDIKKIEQYIHNYQIEVYSDECNLFKRIYKGAQVKEKKIHLLLSDNHFDLLTSVPAFFETRNYCETCDKHYSSAFYKHKCNKVCKACLNKKCNGAAQIICKNCNAQCKSLECLTTHQKKKKCLENKKVCKKCGITYLSNNHICDGRYCFNCKQGVDNDHKCYILTYLEKLAIENDSNKKVKKDDNLDLRKDKQEGGYIFFDYECMIEEYHVPNLIIAEKLSMLCIDNWRVGKSTNCKQSCGIYKFYSNIEFCNWLFQHSGFIAMVHNLSYDGFFHYEIHN